MLLVPIYRLYDRGTTILPSVLLEPRRARPQVALNRSEGLALGIADGGRLAIEWDGRTETGEAVLADDVPAGVALVPRSSGLSLLRPMRGRLRLSTTGDDR
jgi:hypothetical protein